MKSRNFSTALVTGASYGIGEAVARLLAEKGISLILVARSKERLHDLANDLSPLVPVEVIACDLSQRDQLKSLVKAVRSRKPDLIVNNAGFGLYGDVLTWTTEQQQEMIDVDIKAFMELTIEGARTLIGAKKEGVIMNVSSVSAEMKIFPTFTVYAACKAFVNRFSESFDYEVAPHGVRVLASCPGMVDTNFRYRASGNEDQQSSGVSMHVDFVAKEIWWQIQKRKRVHLFDWKYRFLTVLSWFIPKFVLARGMRREIENRLGKRDLIL